MNCLKKFLPFFILTVFTVTILFLIGCGGNKKNDSAYVKEIKQWHKQRIENLKKENGWLNLAGLYWLKAGENRFGSGKDNDIIFPPNAPSHIGVISLKDSSVFFEVIPGANVKRDGTKVDKEIELKNDTEEKPTVLEVDSLRWYIIKRGNKYGIRLRELNAPLLKNFKGIETFPIDSTWKINAEYEAYNPPKKITIPTIIGTVEEEKSPGALVFEKNGKKYKLDVIDEGDSFFIIFADETSGDDTYGAGRFIYTDKPDSNNIVLLDFNKAYNPPCAFTKYATCPLPPKQNYLHLKITAGEKKYAEGH